jgi:hypothetical protein
MTMSLYDQITAAQATIIKHTHRAAQHRASNGHMGEKYACALEIRIAQIYAWIAESRRLGYPAPSEHLIPQAAPAASTEAFRA